MKEIMICPTCGQPTLKVKEESKRRKHKKSVNKPGTFKLQKDQMAGLCKR